MQRCFGQVDDQICEWPLGGSLGMRGRGIYIGRGGRDVMWRAKGYFISLLYSDCFILYITSIVSYVWCLVPGLVG